MTQTRAESRVKQIALQAFTQCPLGWVMAQMCAESRKKLTALQGFTQCPPAWVMAQTRAESNTNHGRTAGHYPIRTLVGNDADAHMGAEKTDCLAGLHPMPTWVSNGADLRREQRKQIALQGFTQCAPGWVMAQMYAESRANKLSCKALPNAHLGV